MSSTNWPAPTSIGASSRRETDLPIITICRCNVDFGLAAGLELLHASPGNDLAICWDLGGNTSHVARRRLRRSSALHLLEDVQHAFRRRDAHQMSSATLRFGHNALRLPSKILWERFQKRNPESAGASVPSRQTGSPFERRTGCLDGRPREPQWSCQRAPCHLSGPTAARSQEISDERPLREANAAATGRRLTTVSPDLKVPIRKNR
jgi:hypothetical protein